MTDFYKELKLDRSKGIEELKNELIKQENIWKQREIYNPEKAVTMLALIEQARAVFASDATRRTYDRELAESQCRPEENDPDEDRREELRKWKVQAESYLESGQYDLAKVAIENALSFSSEIDNDDLYATAARIYLSNNDTAAAMNYINKAIVCAPDVSYYYLLKGFIYDKKAYVYEWRSRNETPLSCWSEERKMYHFSLLKAEQSNDRADLARAYGALAHSYFFEEPQDKEKGKNYAELSLKYGGDANAQPVIDEINKEEQRLKEKRLREAKKLQEEKIREEQERYENELRKKDALYDEALRLSKSQNVSDLQMLSNYFIPYHIIKILMNK